MFDVILLMRNPFLAHLAKGSELLPSLGIRRPLTFHILIFSSETP
jgi:hypothetical protein